MPSRQSRRWFLAGAAMAGAGGAVGFPKPLHAEPPPETATIAFRDSCRLHRALYVPRNCFAKKASPRFTMCRRLSFRLACWRTAIWISAWKPGRLPALVGCRRRLTVLAGVHVGCLELRANDSIQNITDCGQESRNKLQGAAEHLLVSAMAATSADPVAQIDWSWILRSAKPSASPPVRSTRSSGLRPIPGNLARGTSARRRQHCRDPPWSNYFCCMVGRQCRFFRRNPVATKRAMRAILRATDRLP